MNFEVFFIQPEPGHVVEIYTLHRYHYFLTGFCRGVIHTPTHVHFVGGFERVSNTDLRNCRAVPREWECVPITRVSLGVVPEQPWMRVPSHSKGRPS